MARDNKIDRTSGERRALTRRRLLGLGTAAAAGGLLVWGSSRRLSGEGRSKETYANPIEVMARCRRCTGCVAVCPEAALSLGPRCSIVVSKDKCTRCGYCVAVCPTDALRVTREPVNG